MKANRIQELAEQAGLLGPSSRVGNAHEATKKFAEFIIAECAELCEPAAQPEQEPVACIIDGDLYFHHEIDWEDWANQGPGVELLYTSPPALEWVDLTTHQIEEVGFEMLPDVPQKDFLAFARYIETLSNGVNTSPSPCKEWVGLTDDDKSNLWEISRTALPRYATYAILVEAKLKEKNDSSSN